MNGGRSTSGPFGGGLENPMLPSEHQPPTSKRKADDGNTLTNTSKRTKKEPSNKRKLINGEELPGGLMIVRAPPSRPPSAQSNHTLQPEITRPPSRPPSSQSNRPPSSQPHRPPSATPAPHHPPAKKLRVDAASSKPRTVGKGKERDLLAPTREDPEVDEDVRQMESEADALRRQSRANEPNSSNASSSSTVNPAFQFPPPLANPKRHKDALHPLPERDTPQMDRNKILRAENTAQHRRKSSLSRGKRISGSYQATGVISQPHKSVSDNSFYKHIDCDLPEPDRACQLLIWCTSRAPLPSSDPSSSKQKPSTSKNSGKDPPSLPQPSKQGMQILQTLKEDMMKMLADKKIDTNVFTPHVLDGMREDKAVAENTQNVKNRAREIKFNAQIERAKAEDIAWSEVTNFYNSYEREVLADIDKLRRVPSAKAKGKQRATSQEVEDWEPRDYELPEKFRGSDGVELARSIMAEEPERKSPLGQRLEGLPYKIDRIHSFVNLAKQTTDVAEADLNHRFALLSQSLTSRLHSPHPPPSSQASTSLSSFVSPASSTSDPQDLLRALTRVDMERPPAQVGNAARRAAREVQRANEQGGGERRLTGVPPPTPRKAPGTPRRGNTPGRER